MARYRAVVAWILPLVFLLSLSGPRAAVADDSTPTPTLTPIITAESTTPRPTAVPTATLAPSPTAPARPAATREVKKRKHHHRHPTPSPSATSAPHKKRHRRPRKTPTPSPTATPTATPPISLQAEDSVTPVTCNGPGKPNASRSFLLPPYHGWTSVVSYFDHDLPNFEQDGMVETANGVTARQDHLHSAAGFPAYWNASVRQYIYYDGHNGYDYNLWYQPVYAAAAGKVIFAAWEYPTMPDHGYGRMVMIDHHNGYVTLYGHFSRILVHKGQKVRRGQQIGISGNTGHSSGPHLHFTVFHNCSPTDPYGWTGPGDDPLDSYQSETSRFLWTRVPLVSNPLPGWPGLNLLPAGDLTRIALLGLPRTDRGTAAFTRALAAEARHDAARLRAVGMAVRVDLLRGALIVSGRITARTLYALPGIASLTTPDTAEGARADVTQALAHAALVDTHPRVHVGDSSTWTGYLLHWQGRTFLVGRGERGKQVDIRLEGHSHRVAVHRLRADPQTGAYAVDLGKMTPRQQAQLQAELQNRGSGGTAVSVHTVHQVPVRPPATAAPASSPLPVLGFLLILAIMAGTSALLLPIRPRRVRSDE